MSAKVLKLPQKQLEEVDEILTVDEAAAYLKVKKRTLYDHVQRKAIPFLRARKLIRFSKRALLNWMQEQVGG
jgi:excisionase family DNA binding protein